MTTAGIVILIIVAALFVWVIIDTFLEVGRDFEEFQKSLGSKGARGGEGPQTPTPGGPYDHEDEVFSVRVIRRDERGE